jgi:hypothetical protein
MVRIVIFLVFAIISTTGFGQEVVATEKSDTTVIFEETQGIVGGMDTIRFQSKWPDHNPGKASLYSAVLPGLGQAYNKSYWKIPIIYAGFAVFGYFIGENNASYQLGLDCLREVRGTGEGAACLELTNGAGGVTEDQVESFVERARRNRDYTIILGAIFYGLQIVEAHVDAHLKEFSVNEELAFKIKPDFEMLSVGTPYAGIGLTLKF